MGSRSRHVCLVLILLALDGLSHKFLFADEPLRDATRDFLAERGVLKPSQEFVDAVADYVRNGDYDRAKEATLTQMTSSSGFSDGDSNALKSFMKKWGNQVEKPTEQKKLTGKELSDGPVAGNTVDSTKPTIKEPVKDPAVRAGQGTLDGALRADIEPPKKDPKWNGEVSVDGRDTVDTDRRGKEFGNRYNGRIESGLTPGEAMDPTRFRKPNGDERGSHPDRPTGNPPPIGDKRNPEPPITTYTGGNTNQITYSYDFRRDGHNRGERENVITITPSQPGAIPFTMGGRVAIPGNSVDTPTNDRKDPKEVQALETLKKLAKETKLSDEKRETVSIDETISILNRGTAKGDTKNIVTKEEFLRLPPETQAMVRELASARTFESPRSASVLEKRESPTAATAYASPSESSSSLLVVASPNPKPVIAASTNNKPSVENRGKAIQSFLAKPAVVNSVSKSTAPLLGPSANETSTNASSSFWQKLMQGFTQSQVGKTVEKIIFALTRKSSDPTLNQSVAGLSATRMVAQQANASQDKALLNSLSQNIPQTASVLDLEGESQDGASSQIYLWYCLIAVSVLALVGRMTYRRHLPRHIIQKNH